MSSAPVVAGKYTLLRKLGQGGMAEVFLAKQTGQGGFEKLVVIKRILPHLAESREFVTMFLDEARTAADLRHTNVVNVFEVAEDAGTLYMAMEFIHGQDIRKIQRKAASRKETIPLQHACQIIIDAANGLHYAHTKTDLRGNPLSIIHRDVSPQNILVSYEGSTKIVDFGIAKAASQHTHTETGVIKGKYTYMSPEQASGEVIDARSDQFALGIVFWELLTMRRLFKRESEMMTLAAIVDAEVPSPKVYVPDLPEHLEHIVMQCLQKDPADRFDTCEDLMLELEEFLADEGLVHSPARLGQYMRTLFSDVLAKEAALGVEQLDGDSFSSSSLPVGAQPTQADRRSSRSRSRRVSLAVDDADASEPGAKTAFTSSQKAVREGSDDEPSEPTGTTGDVSWASDAGDEPTSTQLDRPEARAEAALRDVDVIPAEPPGPSPSSRLYAALGGGALALLFGLALLVWALLPSTRALTVRSLPPGAEIFLDGEATGKRTPDLLPDLEEGRSYRVRLQLAGYLPVERDVDVAHLSKLDVELVRAKSEGASEADGDHTDGGHADGGHADGGQKPAGKDGRDETAKPDAPKQDDDEARMPRGDDEPRTTGGERRGDKRKNDDKTVQKMRANKPQKARLRIVVKPWAEVYLDGKKVGITPMKPLRLKPGTYKVRLKNPELGKDETVTIKLEPGADPLLRRDW